MIEVNGAKINVEVLENRCSHPTLFLHGNLASNAWWGPSVEYWSSTGEFPLIMMEWRGSGKSEAPSSLHDLRMENLAKDAVSVLEKLNINSANVVGHSTGGLIAMCALLEKPELFNKAVLLDPVGPQGFDLPQEVIEAFGQMKALDRSVTEEVMAGTIKNVDRKSMLFQKIVDDTCSVAEINWSGVPKVLNDTDISSKISKIGHPVLVMHGSEDSVLPFDISKKLALDLPNGEFHPLEGAGHSFNVEDPKEFARISNEFLY